MKEIILTKGMVALVDDEDFEFLNQWKWYAASNNHTFYATRKTSRLDVKRKTILMHRVILNLTESSIEGDHIDGNGLNNQRYNLREATRSQNNANRKSQKKSTSEFIGVSWITDRKKWAASICKDNKRINLGNFNNEIDAAIAYNNKAIELHGDFARINNISKFAPIGSY